MRTELLNVEEVPEVCIELAKRVSQPDVIWSALADYQWQRGEHRQAMESLQKAITLVTSDPTAAAEQSRRQAWQAKMDRWRKSQQQSP